MRRFLFWVAPLLASTACSHPDKPAAPAENANVLMASGFEDLEGWLGETPSLTKEKAHTGQYSVKVDPNIEFGLTYGKSLARLSPVRVNKLRLTAWSFVTEKGSGSAALVFQISPPSGPNVFYDKIELTEAGAWTQVSKVFELPPVLDPASKLSVYLWRSGASSAVYLDDVSLTVEP